MTDNTFQDFIDRAEEWQAGQALDAIHSEQSYYVFLGRPTCGFCRRFVPKLTAAMERTGQAVYYVDSSNGLDPAFRTLRERGEVYTVPSLVKLGQGQIHNFRADSSDSQETIEGYLDS
ncbi:thioredoxin domain-containing protein [Aerococcus sanguinicola]